MKKLLMVLMAMLAALLPTNIYGQTSPADMVRAQMDEWEFCRIGGFETGKYEPIAPVVESFNACKAKIDEEVRRRHMSTGAMVDLRLRIVGHYNPELYEKIRWKDVIPQQKLAQDRCTVTYDMFVQAEYPSTAFECSENIGYTFKGAIVYWLPEKVTPEQFDMLLEGLNALEDRVARLENQAAYPDWLDELMKFIAQQHDSTRAHVTNEHEKTRSVLGGLATSFYVSPGYYFSHYMDNGLYVQVGFENSGGAFFFEGSVTPKEYGRWVEERGLAGKPGFLWGHGYTAGVGTEHNIYSDQFEVLVSISGGMFHKDIGDPRLPEDHEETGAYLRGMLKFVYAPFENHPWVRFEVGVGPELLVHFDHKLLDGEQNADGSYQLAPNELPDPVTGPILGLTGYVALRFGGKPSQY